jgi:predicted transcriptional regulator
MTEEAFSVPKELISKAVFFDYKTPITKVLPVLESKKYAATIITKEDAYYGVVDAKSIYKTQTGMTLNKKQSIGDFAIKVPRITVTSSIDDVIYYFYKTRTRALPYVEGKTIKGVLDRFTLLKIMLSMKMLQEIKVSDAMTTPIVAISADSKLSEAKAAMRSNNVNRFIVMQDNKFVGLLTNYDILHKYTPNNSERLPEMKTEIYSPSNVPVSSVMEPDPKTVNSDSGLADAARKLIEANISSLIALRGRKPVGMLTVTDIIESVVAKRHIEQNNVFISGFDSTTYEYEDEMREQLKSFMDKMEKLSNVKILYATIRLKKIKVREYELHARVALANRGIITVSTSGFLLDRTFEQLLELIKNDVLKIKERYLSVRRLTSRGEEAEE